jgi:hypothetical protein
MTTLRHPDVKRFRKDPAKTKSSYNDTSVQRRRGPKRKPRKRCGDYGGKTIDGKPCPRAAAWGVKGKRTGPCKDHNQAALRRQKKLQQKIMKLYASGEESLENVASMCRITVPVIQRMRRRDAEFDRAMLALIEAVDELRYINVEDTTYKRIIKGEASAQEVIFWLKNRAPHRWKDKVQTEVVDKEGRALIPLGVIREIVTDFGEEPIPEMIH